MFVDLHIHEMTFSADSRMALEEIVAEARAKGLEGICITDHDSMGLKETAEEYARKIGFPIFVGVEYYSLWGDITAWGINDLPQERLPAQAFIDHVRKQGGFCVACHPFRNNNRGLAEHLRDVHGLHGVEVLNGSTSPEANSRALAYCDALGLMPVGASDAHWLSQLGKYATWLPKYVDNLADFVRVLHTGGCRPAILEAGGYRVV
ncbi:MAG: PHP-associated domain-containing protein [Candidatus Pelethousia sp.]|nr:PHP-associated domain-containing protein [Candidatus Pelethousia sp.]